MNQSNPINFPAFAEIPRSCDLCIYFKNFFSETKSPSCELNDKEEGSCKMGEKFEYGFQVGNTKIKC